MYASFKDKKRGFAHFICSAFASYCTITLELPTVPLNRQYLRGSNYTTMINPFVAPTTILYLVEYYTTSAVVYTAYLSVPGGECWIF